MIQFFNMIIQFILGVHSILKSTFIIIIILFLVLGIPQSLFYFQPHFILIKSKFIYLKLSMFTNDYMTKTVIGKKNLRLNSLSQKVKLGSETYYLVEMVGKQANQDDRFFSWQNKFVIERYFELNDEQFDELKRAGRNVEKENNWPQLKAEAIRQILDKFMKLDAEDPADIDENADESILKKLASTDKRQIVSDQENVAFRKRMRKLAKKQRSLDFYVIKGLKRDYFTGEVQFYVRDEMGELKTKTLDQMKERNFMQVIHYLESKIVGYRKSDL